MSSPALLLFLKLDGVLVLNGSSKRSCVADAVRSVASGESDWQDHQELWNQLFEPEPIRQLQILHDQFEPTYCLTSDWTATMDRSATLIVLNLSGLGFVGRNLHARWETGSAESASGRAVAIENWLGINPDHKALWAALDSDLHDSAGAQFVESHADYSVRCCRDVGLSNFETEKLQAALLRRLRESTVKS